MRIVVTSDSHRACGNLTDIVERHIGNADLFINLGDGEDDVSNVLMLYPKIKIKRVLGNCDWNGTYPLFDITKFADKKIFYTHGHIFGVKHGCDELIATAKREGADICLFGHTHIQTAQIIDNMYVVNPGSVAMGEYAIIDIEKGKILVILQRL